MTLPPVAGYTISRAAFTPGGVLGRTPAEDR
jgi:hypothetical protein